MAPIADEFDSECFFITPIGVAGSPERRRSDGVMAAIVGPAADDVGLTAVRADKIDDGGHITLQILEHCTNAKAAVADLTGGNLNVYYEVGIRHALSQPLVLIADESMRDRLPFDLLQQRTIFYTDTLEGAAGAREAVAQQLRRALAGNVDSPARVAADLRNLQQGDAVQQTLAQLVSQVAELTASLTRTEPARTERARTERAQTERARTEREPEPTMTVRMSPDTYTRRRSVVDRGPGLRIREVRQQRAMSIEELANRSDVHATMISRIELGRANPSLATAKRIAAGLGISLSELLSDEHGAAARASQG